MFWAFDGHRSDADSSPEWCFVDSSREGAHDYVRTNFDLYDSMPRWEQASYEIFGSEPYEVFEESPWVLDSFAVDGRSMSVKASRYLQTELSDFQIYD